MFKTARWCPARLRTFFLSASATALLVTLGCLTFPGQTPDTLRVAETVWAEYLVRGAAHPFALAVADDGRVFYTEKDTGRIRVMQNGALLDEPFATVPVNNAGHRGLLGIALHPDFAHTPRVYVFYTRSDTGQVSSDPAAVVDHRVVYFEADGNTAADGEIFVASLPATTFTRRVGGRLAFATDGTLLVAVGDMGDEAGAGEPGSLVGKVLRYTDDGSIPADNPTADSPVFARGLRDPRGLSVDPESGVAFLIDRLPDGRHVEINRILAGQDYGWPHVTGRADTPEELAYAQSEDDYEDPLLDLGGDPVEPAGIAFNPSTRYGPDSRLRLYYGEANTRRIRELALDAARDDVIGNTLFAHFLPSGMTDIAFTPAGTLYVACEDAVLRLVTGL